MQITGKFAPLIKRMQSLIALALAKSAGAQAAIANGPFHATNGAPIGPSGTVAFSTGAVTIGRAGLAQFTATMSLTGTGGTGVAGDQLTAQLLMDGAPLAGMVQKTELSVTGDVTSVAVSGWAAALVAGSSHTFGIQCTDNTGGHTILCSTVQVVGVTT